MQKQKTGMGYADFASQSSTCVRIIQALSSCCVDTPKAQRLGKKQDQMA